MISLLICSTCLSIIFPIVVYMSVDVFNRASFGLYESNGNLYEIASIFIYLWLADSPPSAQAVRQIIPPRTNSLKSTKNSIRF